MSVTTLKLYLYLPSVCNPDIMLEIRLGFFLFRVSDVGDMSASAGLEAQGR